MKKADAITLAVAEIIDAEGGFAAHPEDRGGPTKYGITLRTLAAFWQVDLDSLTPDDVRNLTRDNAARIIRDMYIERPRINWLPARLIGPVADASVLFGPSRAIRMLQTALVRLGHTVAVDGIIGSETRHAAENVDVDALRRMMVVERIGYHVDDIREHPEQVVFLRGWLRRADRWLL